MLEQLVVGGVQVNMGFSIDSEAVENDDMSLPKSRKTLLRSLLLIVFVLSTKGVKLTKQSILEEYERGHEIYDNLPADNPKEYAKPDTAMEEQRTPSVSPTDETQYSSYDTVINNKKAKVVVKKEITYE